MEAWRLSWEEAAQEMRPRAHQASDAILLFLLPQLMTQKHLERWDERGQKPELKQLEA